MQKQVWLFLFVIQCRAFFLILSGCGNKKTIADKVKNGQGGAEMFVKGDLTDEIAECINSDDPSKQGIHSIDVVREDAQKNRKIVPHGKNDPPGIYFY